MSEKVDGDYHRHECNRCNYTWYSTNSDPKTCSSKNCKSPYWNKPRKFPKQPKKGGSKK